MCTNFCVRSSLTAVRQDRHGKGGDAFTARMDCYLGYSIEVGEFGVAHVWFQRYEKGYFEKCLKHYFRHSF